MGPIVAHASGRILRSVIAPIDRETFDRAQRRNRRDARIRAIPAVLAAAAMGIPLGVYLSPVLIALAIVLTDLLNFLVPTVDVGGAVWGLLDRLIDGDPGTVQALIWIAFVWILPGIALLVLAYLVVSWRLRRIGGEGIALALGARPPRPDDFEEQQLANVVAEYGVAAGVTAPGVLVYDDGPADAFAFGGDHQHATVVVARALLRDLDREQTQGIVARAIASAVDGDLGLAVDIGAVYVTYGLLGTTLSAFVSHEARVRLRAALAALTGRAADAQAAARGAAALLGQAADDDVPDTTAAGCLTLLTMGGFIGVAISLINLFLAGPLLTFAWRSRGYLADATSVDLSRDPDGLARALAELDGRRQGVPGIAWLELLLVVGGSPGGEQPAVGLARLSDSGLAASLAPSINARLKHLRSMGADSLVPDGGAGRSWRGGRQGRRGGRRGIILLAAILVPLIALLAVLILVALVLVTFLIAFAAFVVLAIVAGPIHDLLRGLAGR
jgi:Zn-dependent protease with chaperone function